MFDFQNLIDEVSARFKADTEDFALAVFAEVEECMAEYIRHNPTQANWQIEIDSRDLYNRHLPNKLLSSDAVGSALICHRDRTNVKLDIFTITTCRETTRIRFSVERK